MELIVEKLFWRLHLMDEHDYWQDKIDQLRIEELRKHCSGCPYWDDYYLCTMGSCVYADM